MSPHANTWKESLIALSHRTHEKTDNKQPNGDGNEDNRLQPEDSALRGDIRLAQLCAIDGERITVDTCRLRHIATEQRRSRSLWRLVPIFLVNDLVVGVH